MRQCLFEMFESSVFFYDMNQEQKQNKTQQNINTIDRLEWLDEAFLEWDFKMFDKFVEEMKLKQPCMKLIKKERNTECESTLKSGKIPGKIKKNNREIQKIHNGKKNAKFYKIPNFKK